MVKKVGLLALLLVTSHAAFAQSDAEVISMGQKLKNEGASDQQVVISLMEKGISMDRIQQLRANFTSQQVVAKTDANHASNSVTDTKVNAVAPGVSTVDAAVTSDDTGFAVSKVTDRKMEKKKSQIFGHDIFNNASISFEPNENISTPNDYRLGTGDLVYIEVFGATQKTINARISAEGMITVPMIGPIHLSGLTVSQANAQLRSQMGPSYSNSRIQLYVGKAKTIKIQVMGEVNYPGTYTVSSFASVFHALYLAGGPNEIGTLRAIKVYRDGSLVTVVDVYDYILNGNLKGNVSLRDNDVIVVSTCKCLVKISGKVWRPMFYEMKPNETVKTLISYAGGFTGDAYKDEVQLVRSASKEKSIFTIDEEDMYTFQLADRDEITVSEILDRYSNKVDIYGAVFRPGSYQMGGKINTVRDLVNAAQGTTEIAFPEYAVLHRRRADKTLEAYTVNIANILDATDPDIPLRKDDELFIPTRKDMMTSRTVTIHGEVYKPGSYPFAEKQTLENLIMLAGGLTDKASAQRVEVSRRIVDPLALAADSVKSQTFTFTLQEGYIVSENRGFVLQPFDHVYVRRSPVSREAEMVTITGKVQFEGSYPLAKEGMRLSDLVKLAGGTKIGAYTHGARLLRKINAMERIVMQDVLEKAKNDYSMLAAQNAQQDAEKQSRIDYMSKVNDMKLGDNYYVGIELDKALAHPGSDDDVIIREGDQLIVPEYSGTISITGEVEKDNTVAYLPGKGLKYYIEQAGGYSQFAKKSHAFIIHMNGTISKAKNSGIEPGCQIVVPMKPMHKKFTLAELMTIGSSSASLATMVATIGNIIKK